MAETPGIPSLFEWQQTRRKPDGVFAAPTSGFGPGGNLTLWLPPSKPSMAWKFVDGKPVAEPVEAQIDPVREELRRKVLHGIKSVADGILEVEPAFLEYAAHCITRNYIVSDTDLAYCLLNSAKWHQPMITHILGGEDMVELLAGAADTRRDLEAIGRAATNAAVMGREVEAARESTAPYPHALHKPAEAPRRASGNPKVVKRKGRGRGKP